MQVYDRRMAVIDQGVKLITIGLPQKEVLVGFGAANLGVGGAVKIK